MTSLDDLPDELVRWALGFLSHGGGKAAVARTGRRARDLHAVLLSPGFAVWAKLLSRERRSWVAGLAIAPPIRAGFESGSAFTLSIVALNNDVIKRLLAFNSRFPSWQLGEGHTPWQRPTLRDAVLFIALGLLTDVRIEELLEAKLNFSRWQAVFARCPGGVLNTMLIDQRFSFAEWKKEIVTSKYEMMVAVKQAGMALQWASDELKSDRGVVEQAVNK